MVLAPPTSLTPAARSTVTLRDVGTVVWQALAVLSSIALIWLAHSTFVWCFGYSGGCGTPCATSSTEMLFAPIVLVLPFTKLLAAQGLSGFGLVARCAVTSAIGVWGVGIVILWSGGRIFF